MRLLELLGRQDNSRIVINRVLEKRFGILENGVCCDNPQPFSTIKVEIDYRKGETITTYKCDSCGNEIRFKK